MILTIIIASVVLLLAALGLAVGRLITGKDKLHCKRCGTPEKKECSLCDKPKCTRKSK